MNPFVEGVLKSLGSKAAEAVMGGSAPKPEPSHVASQVDLAELYKQGILNMGEDDYLAVQFFMTAAKKGHAPSMLWLAKCLCCGVGCVKNEEDGLNWAQSAAEKGDQDAINFLSSQRVWKDHGWVLGASPKQDT